MNRDVIKYIAIIAMTLNHISNIFLDPDTLLGEALLDIGYFTAVTMCYFLVEGYHYTHSKKKYGQRLLVFALISQIPFQEAVGAAAFNMLFTLFFCFLILCAKEYIRRPAERTVAIICLTACTLFGDWALLAAVFTLLFDWSRGDKKKTAWAYGIAFVVFGGINFLSYYMAGDAVGQALLRTLAAGGGIIVSGVIMLCFYNGKKSPRSGKFGKWFFYVYYPAHLAVLVLLRAVV